ncbi:unnamed protein product [Schistosoma turkestanicum]|nr:unnamed protein product [Schistosoma turkestanicum]
MQELEVINFSPGTFGSTTTANNTPFIHLSKELNQTIDQACTTTTTFWSTSENTHLPDYLIKRLHRMLCNNNTTDKSSNIGRFSELYIYHILNESIRSAQTHQNNFDQMTNCCAFPIGHSLLGVGRLIRCDWCNSDVESLKPYDLEIDVQVECDAANWDKLIENLTNEIANNIVRIIRRPTTKQPNSIASSSSSSSGLLNVGPIFLEVKSTIDSSSAHNTQSRGEINADSETDLFEFSLSELVCASQQNWRYHLLRVLWKKNDTGNVDADAFFSGSLLHAPKIIHIPNLANHLRQKSMNLRLCLAMLRNMYSSEENN